MKEISIRDRPRYRKIITLRCYFRCLATPRKLRVGDGDGNGDSAFMGLLANNQRRACFLFRPPQAGPGTLNGRPLVLGMYIRGCVDASSLT